MKTAIVILNWNGQKMMAQYLPTVIEYSRDDADVIVADNASTDDSVGWLSKKYPQVRQIVLDKNYGFAEGYNRALKQVDAEYYVLLNSDVEVTHHWLTPLIEEMDAHPDIAACQPKLLSIHDRDAFEYAGAAGGYIDRYGYPYCRGRIFDTVEDDNGQYDNAQEVLWATGACLVVRAKDYWAAGGLDGRFFAHNEEIDLCWRLHRMGKRIFCFPESEVYHVGGGTLPKSNPMKTFLNFRNNLTMLYKNLPEKDLKKVMRVRWFLDYLAAFETLLVNHNWGDFCAIFRARRAFRRWRHDFDSDRLNIEHGTLNIEHSKLNDENSKFKPQSSNLKVQSSMFKPQSSMFKVPMVAHPIAFSSNTISMGINTSPTCRKCRILTQIPRITQMFSFGKMLWRANGGEPVHPLAGAALVAVRSVV